jgi:hypothetical protein
MRVANSAANWANARSALWQNAAETLAFFGTIQPTRENFAADLLQMQQMRFSGATSGTAA